MQNELDKLKGKNPFKVPEGYLEGLTEQVMARIPERSREEPKVVSLLDRIRPWLYLAGVFAGLFIFFKVFINPASPKADDQNSALFVQVSVSGEMWQVISEDDMDYLEFMEDQYLDRLYAEEIDSFEDEIGEIE